MPKFLGFSCLHVDLFISGTIFLLLGRAALGAAGDAGAENPGAVRWADVDAAFERAAGTAGGRTAALNSLVERERVLFNPPSSTISSHLKKGIQPVPTMATEQGCPT